LGASLKGWTEKWDQQSSNGVAADLGVQFSSVFNSLNVGVAARNLGPSTDGHPLPTSMALGASLNPFAPITFLSEIDYASHRDTALRLGLEFHQHNYWLRSGFQTLTSDLNESLAQFSFGAGIHIKGWRIDYAWVPKGDLGDQHRVAMSIGLGLTPEERQKLAAQLDKKMVAQMKTNAHEHMSLAKNAMAKKDWATAETELSRALLWDKTDEAIQQKYDDVKQKRTSAEFNTLYQKGKRSGQQKQWVDAVYYYRQALKRAPHNKKAKAALKKANQKIKASANKGLGGGINHYINGDYKAAIRAWEKALKANPHQPQIREYVAKAKAKMLENEIESLKKNRPSKEETIETLSQQAYTFYTTAQTDKAIAAWEEILALDKGNTDARRALKEASERERLNLGSVPPTKQQRVQQLNSNALHAYMNGELKHAVKIWQQVLKMDPHNNKVKNNLSRAILELKANE
jgi:hypothetical protein